MSPACRLIALTALGVLLAACRPPSGVPGDAEIVVLAAASMTDVVTRVAAQHEAATGSSVRCSFASSSTLARQIEAGADADVFISASIEWMERLDAAGRLAGPPIEIAGNGLVLVVPGPATRRRPAAPLRGEDIRAIAGRIAMGDPAHVPAGRYARAALEHLGVWDDVEQRVVATVDVRAALRLAEMDAVDAAIVYATDAADTERASIVGTFASDAHPPIRYPAAAIRGASDEARRFVASLRAPAARAILVDAGFTVPEGAVIGLDAAAVWEPVRLSLLVATACVLVTLAPGVLAGWVLARLRFPGKTLLDAIIHLPLVLPPVVVGYVLLIVLGRQGVLGRWLRLDIAFTWQAAVIAASVMAFPLLVRSVRLAIELGDERLEQAARVLGASAPRTFLTITLPLALPGVLTGMVLAFARSLGEFGATITFAGNVAGETRTLPLAVFTFSQAPGGDRAALLLAGVAIALSLGALVTSEVIARRLRARIGR